jgi:hypothetical protein
MRTKLPRPRWLVALGAAVVAMLAMASVALAHGNGHGGDQWNQGDHWNHGHGGGHDGWHPGHPGGGDHGTAEHVLLLSVDGLHESDLRWYVGKHPHSALASLVGDGVEFSHAQTPVPSDSFPGMVGQVTGGNPGTTGVYYDETYNRELLPAGTTNCAGAKPGTPVLFTEEADKNLHALDAGQGLTGLPGSILQMTGDPATLINPAALPVDPTTCKPVYPHEYLRVNTIFEVAKEAGLRTAWIDKHPAYDILQGPSGEGIDDLFTPEINSDAPTEGSENDWTTDNALTEQYDGYKVKAVLNEIKGYDHSGTEKVGVPAIFGMNFQTVSTAEKLPESDGLKGGYEANLTPGPLLRRALEFINTKVGSMMAMLHAQHLAGQTTIILSAKHGQSPIDPAALTRISDGPIIEGLDSAWATAHPEDAEPLVAFSIDDDAMILWLNYRTPEAEKFAKEYLLAQSGTGNGINGEPKAYTSSGLATVYAGEEASEFFGTSFTDSRVPDIYGVVQHGVVYTSKKSKIAEHGGADADDRSVPLVVSGGPIDHHAVEGGTVETTQIAPTILSLLGLDPDALEAVEIEGTEALNLH